VDSPYHSSEAVEVVDDHVEVFALVEVVDLEQVLSLEAVGLAALQVKLDVLALK